MSRVSITDSQSHRGWESRYFKENSLLELFQEELIRNPLGEWIMLTRTRNPVPKLNVQLIHIALYLNTFTLTCNVDELQILTSRFAMLSPASAHPHRPEVCTDNFFLPARAISRYKRAQTGFLGTKGHLVPGFLGQPLLQLLFHVSSVSCQKREARNPQTRHFYRAKRLFASLSWSEFALCYQRGLKPPK